MARKIKAGETVLLLGDEATYMVKAAKRGFNVDGGLIELDTLIGKTFGSVIKTHKGREFIAVEPNTNDLLAKRMRRLPQVITPKDMGLIVGMTGIQCDAKVVEAGTGSGHGTLFLSRYCSKGKIYTYELRRDFFENVKHNLEEVGVKNVKMTNADIRLGFKEKDVDLVMLDMIGAEDVIEQAFMALKPGAFLVVYSPYIEQVKAVVDNIKKFRFTNCYTVENMLRHWDVRDHTLPQRFGTMHTGFMTFARKLV